MPDPQLTFDREELELTITGLGGGWTFGQLGELRLFDQAQVQFPSSWSRRKMALSQQIVETQWRLNAHLVLEQTLTGGIEFSRADGVGSSMSVDHELLYHLMERPSTQIDLYLNVKLDGEFDGHEFSGSGAIGVGIRGRF